MSADRDEADVSEANRRAREKSGPRQPGPFRVIRGRTATFVVAGAVSAILGLIAGVSVAAGLHPGNIIGHGGAKEPTAVSASVKVDIVHNPPLLYVPGDSVTLVFDLVCPGDPCGAVDAVLTLSRPDARPTLLSTHGIDRVEFRVPASLSESGDFAYRGEFQLSDGTTANYPSADGMMSVMPFSEATEVDLGAAQFATDEQQVGDLVVSGSWGEGPTEFGINAQLSGPSSFDVDPTTGDIVIVDQVNSRLVRVSTDGKSQTSPIVLRAGVPDLAIAPDGTLDVLYVNAVSGATLEQFAPDGGKAIREIPLATPSGNAIRRLGDSIAVEADDSYWVPISQGQRILSPDEQTAAAAPGLALAGHLVVRKHLRELGNEVRISESGPSGVRAWRLGGRTPLGPVLIAEPLPNGRVAVVQSQFENDNSQYTILTLGDGEVRTIIAPQALYAGLYDPSEFRLDGNALYQVRSTKSEFSIYRYQLG